MAVRLRHAASALARRSRAALPGRRAILLGAPGWGLAMALSAFVHQWQTTLLINADLAALLALFGLGGAAAFVPALFLARLVSHEAPAPTRFAAHVVALSAATIGVTALVFALIYRGFYAQWHGHALSITWAYQFVFTMLGAAYQFLVVGMRHYLPVGALALFVTATVLARRR